MTRYVEAVPEGEATARCSLCGSEMEPFVGWDWQSEWVMLWWSCEGDPEHLSAALPFPRRSLRGILEQRV